LKILQVICTRFFWRADPFFLFLCHERKKNKMAVFQEKEIRRIWHQEEWWFAIVDVVEALSETKDVRQYIKKMRSRDPALNAKWGTICTPLHMVAPDGKTRATNAANTEGIFRIIQSIPSPKAEPFKAWLAKVGYERVQEIENPELAAQRLREYYQALGYSEEWIERRMQAIFRFQYRFIAKSSNFGTYCL